MRCGGRLGWRFRLIVALAGLLGVCCSAGCRNDRATDENTLERIRREGVVRIGYANEAPFAYFDEKTGRLTGEAPEIARVLLSRMGIERIEGVLTEFGSLIPGLKAKRFDVIAAGMYILPERCREISFTNPTYKVGEAFLVQAGNPLDLHGYQDVANHPEARIGVVAGAVELSYARAIGIPSDRIAVLPDPPSAVAAVRSGRVDAYAGTRLTIGDMLSKLGEGAVEQAEPFQGPVIGGRVANGFGAFGVRKEDVALLNAFNEGLRSFIGSAEHLALVKPFGFTEAELPGDAAAETLCREQ